MEVSSLIKELLNSSKKDLFKSIFKSIFLKFLGALENKLNSSLKRNEKLEGRGTIFLRVIKIVERLVMNQIFDGNYILSCIFRHIRVTFKMYKLKVFKKFHNTEMVDLQNYKLKNALVQNAIGECKKSFVEINNYGSFIYISGYFRQRVRKVKYDLEKYLIDNDVPMIFHNGTSEKLHSNTCKEIPLKNWNEKMLLIEECLKFKDCTISFVLVGEPGVGKTTFVRNLAKRLNKSVHISPVGNLKQLPPRDILFFDDFDKNSNDYNVSDLLDLLDGIGKSRQNIVIFNVNNLKYILEKYDTMIRPGRSQVLHFTKPTKDELEEYRNLFCPGVEIQEGDTFAVVEERYLQDKIKKHLANVTYNLINNQIK